ncbi:SAM-dependent methyltransferase [Desulfoscipio sp. XC116]|uniref:SAM-dependent methyltransferase n=1 Tax=Desulfoscipio sp. XC116 TaxID=3144975 RepID=UPI00325B1A6A
MQHDRNHRGKFYVVGIGPAGPQTATLQALEAIRQADAIVAPLEKADLFADYIQDKPVLFDPWEGFWEHNGVPCMDLEPKLAREFQNNRFKARDERVGKIRALLEQGQNVALLDSGNPCFFAPSHWYVEQFDERELEIIPGMGCEAAALAALGKSIIPSYGNSFVLQTSAIKLKDFPLAWPGQKDIHGNMVIYMVFKDPVALFFKLAGLYTQDTPCAIVYWAGDSQRQRVIRGTVKNMAKKIEAENNRMGLLFVGDFLTSKPYEAAMRRDLARAGE